MQRHSDLPLEQCIYRRITPTSWESGKGSLKTNVFRLRQQERSLSVYRADKQTPRGVLQICINDQERKLHSGDENERARAENFFRLYGTTVESLVENGWRVARLPLSTLADKGFTIDEPDENGHQNVSGAREEFERYSKELGGCADLLSAEQCLAE